MSLSDVLSATKDLIYSHIELPPHVEERIALYRGRYPALTVEEIEDLAKMEPARIRIYTGTVYAGERNTVRMHFPLTFNLIRRAAGGRFDSMAMIHVMHEEYPWTEYTTRDLAEKFARFVTKELAAENPSAARAGSPDAGSVIAKIIPPGASWTPEPFLAGAVELELHELISARAEDSSGSALDPASLASLTVGELLELELIIPPATSVFRTAGDILQLRREFIRDEEGFTVPPYDGVRRSLLGGRDNENYLRWVQVPDAVAELFTELMIAADPRVGRSEPLLTVQTLAEAVVAAVAESGEERTEEQLFGELLSLLSQLLERGILLKA